MTIFPCSLDAIHSNKLKRNYNIYMYLVRETHVYAPSLLLYSLEWQPQLANGRAIQATQKMDQ